MARGSARIPPELLINENAIEEPNIRWLEEYKKAKKPSKVYYELLSRFLRFSAFENKPFDKFNGMDVLDFINIMWQNGFSKGSCNSLVSVLNSFRTFLIEEYPREFDEHFLFRLPTLRDTKESNTNVFDAERLDLTQLRAVRQYNKEHSNQDEYIFELYFQLGIKKGEILNCHPINRDKNQNKFIYKDKSIPYNNKINDILNNLGNVEKWKWNITTIDIYLLRVTEHLRKFGFRKKRSLRYSDIKASHHAYVLECPICKSKSENTRENWVLASSNISEELEYHIVCSICKGSPNGY